MGCVFLRGLGLRCFLLRGHIFVMVVMWVGG
jgi:hypothetical protein